MPKQKPDKGRPSNEGEGNQTANRQYRDGVKKFLKNEDPIKITEKAIPDLDDEKFIREDNPGLDGFK